MTERDEARARLWSFAKITMVALPSIESVSDPAERRELALEYAAMQAILDELQASKRDREALAVYGLLHEGKMGQHWIYAAAGRLAAGDPEADVLADFGYTKDRKALEELRGHLSKTVALAERDRRNLLGLNDAVKGPGGGRAQLREWIAAHPEAYSLSSKGLMADLLIDIDSAERDREALAEARELLVVFRGADVIDRFLKRTEPKP